MKKTQFKQRFENAVSAFFEDEFTTENNSLAYAGSAELLHEESSKIITEKLNVFLTILKQIFFFLPGTFVLYFLSMVFGILAVFKPPMMGSPRFPYSYMAVAFVISIFATWFGLGDIKKPRHLVIPLSIVSTSFLVGIITGMALNLSESFEVIMRSDLYPMCIFPFILMVPFLAKMWVDVGEKEM